MTATAEGSSGTGPDLLGASQSLAGTVHAALGPSVLKPETLKGLNAAVSTMARAFELPQQSVVPNGTLGALAAWNRAVKSVQLPVLSDSARQAMTRSIAAAAGLNELSKSTAALTSAVLKDYEPMRIALAGLQDSMARLTEQMIPDESLRAIASALTKINASVKVSATSAAAQAATMRHAADGSYEHAARQLVENLGVVDHQELPPQVFEIDAAASAASYDLISEHAPEVAAEIDEAADQVRTSFLDRKLVRYSLASLVFILIMMAWILLATPDLDLIPQPWRGVLRSAAESAPVAAPAALVIARSRSQEGWRRGNTYQ